jgi:hypothetical protein
MPRLDCHAAIRLLTSAASRAPARPREGLLRSLRFGAFAHASARSWARGTANFGNFRAS